MDVFFQELKRQLSLKRVMTYVLVAITLALLWAWFIVGGATENFMQIECYKNYKGKTVIEAAAMDRRDTTGEMTDDKFQKGCDAFLNSLKGKDENDIVMSEDLLKYSVYADKLIMQEFSLRSMRGDSTKEILKIPKDAGKYFYENENLCYRNYIDENSHNQNEKSLALSLWDKVKKPYTYYSGFKQWGEGIQHIVLFSFVLMIMVGIFAGSIIAKDKETGIDEIIVTTMKGRTVLTTAKIIIPWIMAFVIYIFGVGFYIVLLKYLLPSDALNTSIQVLSKSFLPYTEGELLKKVFILGVVGIITIASFSTWVSSINEKSSKAIQISILTILASLILGIFININSPIINAMKILIPGGTVFSSFKFEGFSITTILGKVFVIPSISIVVSVIIFLLSTVFVALNYKRR